MRHPCLVALMGSIAALSIGATLAPPFFLGAGPGTDVPFETVVLPSIVTAPLPLAGAGVGGAVALPTLPIKSAFSPTLQQLLEGQTVITTDKQMREVWHQLFSEPYDAGQFDFEDSFVVLMGGGAIANGSFDISAVELVQAEYSEPGGPGGRTATETFLSVTATTFLSGVPPENPPSATWLLSAVKIPRDQLDDVVFRRNVILGV